jgi:hypothetical protein
MGQMTQATIRAWQERAGIKEATGEYGRVLTEMSKAAFELIEIIVLEKSGIRDGDGFWHGSDPLSGTLQDIVKLDARMRGMRNDAHPTVLAPSDRF